MYAVVCYKCGYWNDNTEKEVTQCPQCKKSVFCKKIFDFETRCGYCDKKYGSSVKRSKMCYDCAHLLRNITKKRFLELSREGRLSALKKLRREEDLLEKKIPIKLFYKRQWK